MFFIKKELLKNWYIVILGMLVTAFVFSVSMVLFSLSSSVKDNHIKELIKNNPNGLQIHLDKDNFERFDEIKRSDDYQFIIYTSNSLSIHKDDNAIVKNKYTQQIGDQFLYVQFNGFIIQTVQQFPLFIERNFTFSEQNTNLDYRDDIYPIYLSQTFATYLNLSLDDEIELGFLDANEELINDNDLVKLKVFGIYDSDIQTYAYIHYFITMPELKPIYQSYNQMFNQSVIINDFQSIYSIYQALDVRGMVLIQMFGFADYLQMNQNMSVVFMILSMIVLVIGIFLLLHITFLMIKNRMQWISMVKSLGLSSKLIVFVYVVIMQFILLISSFLSAGLAYLINRRIEYLAERVLDFQFVNRVHITHFISVYVIAFILVCMLSFIVYRFIRKHSVNELIRVES
ncbi:MAG: hypothetical protein RBT45_02870 [Acholeplasmataceae bacterium]|jgi:ABC-type lipoprotein release transport system permease subunit|nr:hypothetical protein [Acholeplasmataceae bacterium]